MALPICGVLGGSFATYATVATIEGVANHSFLSCLNPNHFPKLHNAPLDLYWA